MLLTRRRKRFLPVPVPLHAPLSPHVHARGLRVGIVTPGLGLGGAERWIVDMVEWVKGVQWQGVATLNTHINNPQIVESIRAVCPVYEYEAGIQTLLSQCDIGLVWGIPESGRFFEGTDCKRILVSQGTALSPHTLAACTDAASADGLVGISTYAREAFPETERDRVSIIPLATDAARCRISRSRDEVRAGWGVPHDKKILGYLGRLVSNKYPQGLIEAIAVLPADWVGVLAGQGPFLPTLQTLAERYGVAERIYFVGPQYEIGNTLQAFDWSYFCSDAEGWGLVFVESWLAGVPVVATPVGAAGMYPECVVTVPKRAGGTSIAAALLAHDGTEETKRRVWRARKFAAVHCTMEAFADAWQKLLRQYAQDRRIRFGILMPVMARGGAERSSYYLARSISDASIRYAGCAVRRDGSYSPAMLHEFAALGPVYMGEAGCRDLAAQCDVMMSWGLPEPDQYTRDTACKIIQTSRGNDTGFTANALRGSERAAAIVAVSPSSVAAVPEPQQARTIVIPNMVDASRLRPLRSPATVRHDLGIAADAVLVGCVGRLDDNKRPALLIEALRDLPAHWCALLVGAGAKRGELEALAKQNLGARWQRRVIFSGAVDAVGDIYGALDALTVLSKNEGFCNVMAEAWLLGVPVIGTRVGLSTERPDLIAEIPPWADGAIVADCLRADMADLASQFQRVQRARAYARMEFGEERFRSRWAEVITRCHAGVETKAINTHFRSRHTIAFGSRAD